MDWSHIFSIKVQHFLPSFIFIWRYLDFANKFFLKKIGRKFWRKINVCCCLILLLVLSRFLSTGRSHQSNVAFSTPMKYLRWRRFFFIHKFFEKYLNFWGFPSFLMRMSVVGNLCANVVYRASLYYEANF